MEKGSFKKSYECCIVGAGPAGLGTALELAKKGITDIVIIDKNKIVGGLARTDVFDGIRFDVGPHRFYTKNSEIDKIWHDILGKDFKPVSRLTRIFYKNKYFNYPVKIKDVLVKLGFSESLSAVFSFVFSQITKKSRALSFEDLMTQKFGRKLYETFFKTYTEKVWGIPCTQIGPEWARQRIKGLDAFEVIKNALRGGRNTKIKSLVEEFNYPVWGSGQMYEAMSDEVLSQGAELMLDSKVISFNLLADSISSIDVMRSDASKVNITAKHFFSSVALSDFFHMLNPPDSGLIKAGVEALRYRDHITVNLLIDKEAVFPDQWIYVQSKDIQTARVVNYNNFSKAMTGHKNKTALSVEYFCFQGKGLWNKPDTFLGDLATSELCHMGLIEKSRVDKFWVVRETKAYPLCYVGFEESYRLLKSRVDRFTNFYSIGRSGMHKYNNQDHSILSGMLAARNYLKLPGTPYILWDVNADSEYLEHIPR